MATAPSIADQDRAWIEGLSSIHETVATLSVHDVSSIQKVIDSLEEAVRSLRDAAEDRSAARLLLQARDHIDKAQAAFRPLRELDTELNMLTRELEDVVVRLELRAMRYATPSANET